MARYLFHRVYFFCDWLLCFWVRRRLAGVCKHSQPVSPHHLRCTIRVDVLQEQKNSFQLEELDADVAFSTCRRDILLGIVYDRRTSSSSPSRRNRRPRSHTLQNRNHSFGTRGWDGTVLYCDVVGDVRPISDETNRFEEGLIFIYL